MKMPQALAALCLLFSSIVCCQTTQPLIFQPKANSAIATPAARCDSTSCQQNCYVQNSRCDRNNGSGCSSTMQACMQACTTQCR